MTARMRVRGLSAGGASSSRGCTLIGILLLLWPILAHGNDFAGPPRDVPDRAGGESRLYWSSLPDEGSLQGPLSPESYEPPLIIYPSFRLAGEVHRRKASGNPWFVRSHSSYHQSIRRTRGEVMEKRYGLGYDMEGRLAVGADLGFAGLREEGEDGGGSGFDFFTRWHPVKLSRWSLGPELKLGLLFTDRELPTGGTKVNFSESIGLVLAYELESGNSLSMNVAYQHVSNGHIFGGRRTNPGWDSVGLAFTYAVRL